MSNLRLALVIDAIDNSVGVFNAFEQRAAKAVKSVGERFEKVSQINEGISSSIAKLGLGVSVGLEFHDAVEDAEWFERIAYKAGLARDQVKGLQDAFYGAAQQSKISADQLISAWDQGAQSSGGSLGQFRTNIDNIATQIQLAGGHGPALGLMLGGINHAGVVAPEDVSQVFSTMWRQLIGSHLDIDDVAPRLGQMSGVYQYSGHQGPAAIGDLAAVLATIGTVSPKPKQAMSSMESLLSILTNRQQAMDLQAHTGVQVLLHPEDVNSKATRSLPDILRELAEKDTGGLQDNIARSLGSEVYLGLSQVFADIRAHGASSEFERRLAIRGDPDNDRETAADLAANPTGALNAVQNSVRSLGVAIVDATKPVWAMIGAHSKLLAGIGYGIGIASAAGWGWKILATALSPAIGALNWLRIGAAGLIGNFGILVSEALPAVGDAFIAVGAVIEATPIGWIIGGIAMLGGVAYELWNHWSGFKTWWHDMWSGAADDVDAAFKHVNTNTEKHAIAMRGKGFGTTNSSIGNRIVAAAYNLLSEPGTEEQQKRQKQAFDYFQSQGWSAAAAAGITARIGRESHFNERAWGDSGLAYGAMQWHADRADAIAGHFGKSLDKMNFGEQLEAINWELHGPEKKAGQDLANAESGEKAGEIASAEYARPRNRNGEALATGSSAEQLMRLMGQASNRSAQRVSLMVSGLPAGAKVKASSEDSELDLGLGHHMAPAQ